MHPKTLAIQAGYEKGKGEKSIAVPIYQTTAYKFDDTEHGANLFDLKELGNIYTRIMNPTTDVLEKRVALLEGGVAALASASGMASIFYAVANLAQSGENIIATTQLYGGTLNQFTHTLSRFGIEVRFFDGNHPQEARALIDSKSRALFFESLTNPSIDVPEIDTLAKIADEYGIVSIVDNTVATPAICRPIEHGVDVVVHSASKYMGGQGLAIGGVLVESARVAEKLRGNPRYPHFNTPDPSYHGLVYASAPLPPFVLRARLALLRDIGATLSPFDSWLFIQGIETLSVRMREHSLSAMKIAHYLQNHPKVQAVYYPGLESDKNHANAVKYFDEGMFSGLLSFEVGDFELAQKIADSVKIFTLATNIGDTKSIITHSASTTHRQVSAEGLKKAGVTPGLVRLSIGLEDYRDLIEDLAQAIDG
ncbi:O-acetylhomoserine aminocarboxypropyltransferase/cysteine synthase family protein [Wolinella succinogenes]|uniref:O-succinylhomoserine sulfhydrylase n=1 Tax=Wolinella succinogenes (strain ATCC 29543 / DSM 1740 / CCUG 13145 / JCM 31913 / LMG 7466 / NCTC 11488 / FDC 602W) TaxID=273121 RepID=Q7M844_WOLSU|nr:O-acetylhomoserine aminocarboxypropyltransferase/cysteine synthase family protein [Wolinella succinogenes]NLU34980.1 O-acetylhomoserine aminocarboxypropyltransferase/cysteine synthase [Wolinella succinogenes]CAE10904.1 O-ACETYLHOMOSERINE (THIOL)-LYASE [Wolinella succinogenes]VEG81063.1 Methionine gamma-lyase [Wolinella succinogenes]HCZ18444.1 O-acetylhomoserine aminocarboxypropyltransferase/cysteine synthase [Helicobacter sp.]